MECRCGCSWINKKSFSSLFKKKGEEKIKIKSFYIISLFIIVYGFFKIKRNLFYEGMPYLSFLWDVLPNLLAGISGTITLSYYLFFKKNIPNIWLSPFIISIYLTLEEYYPIISYNYTFDYNDIIVSWVGSFFGYLVYKKIIKNEK